MEPEKTLDISWTTILKLGISALGFYIIFLIRDILIWILFAIVISVLFDPVIEFLKKGLKNRIASTILVYVLVFGILGFSFYSVAPLFVKEIQQFVQLFPQYFEKISPPLRGLGIEAFESFEAFTNALEETLKRASANIFTALGTIFGGIFSAFTIFSIALFLSLEEKGIEKVIKVVAPKKYEVLMMDLWTKTQKKISGWFGARILCCLFVGVMTFVVCQILNITYSASFGFLAGIFNFIPIIGPLVIGLLIFIVAGLDSWLKGIFFLIAFSLIQQIENNILTPVLTRKIIGLPSVLVIIALIIGGKLWGLLGAILAIPLAGILFEFLRDFLIKRKEGKAVII